MPRFAPYGFARSVLNVQATLPGTGQTTVLLSYPLGFQFELESVKVCVTTAGGGAGATRALNIRKGNATGTVVATGTITLAAATLGAVIDIPVTTTGTTNVFGDSDTITAEFPAGGTAFSAGAVTISLVYRHRLQRALGAG